MSRREPKPASMDQLKKQIKSLQSDLCESQMQRLQESKKAQALLVEKDTLKESLELVSKGQSLSPPSTSMMSPQRAGPPTTSAMSLQSPDSYYDAQRMNNLELETRLLRDSLQLQSSFRDPYALSMQAGTRQLQEELQQAHQMLSQQAQVIQSECSSYELQLQTLNDHRMADRQRIQELTAECSKYQQQLQLLREELDSERLRLQQMAMERSAYLQQLQRLKEEKEADEEQWESWSAERLVSSQKLQEAASRYERDQYEIKHLRAQVESKTKRLQEAKARLTVATEANSKLTAEQQASHQQMLEFVEQLEQVSPRGSEFTRNSWFNGSQPSSPETPSQQNKGSWFAGTASQGSESSSPVSPQSPSKISHHVRSRGKQWREKMSHDQDPVNALSPSQSPVKPIAQEESFKAEEEEEEGARPLDLWTQASTMSGKAELVAELEQRKLKAALQVAASEAEQANMEHKLQVEQLLARNEQLQKEFTDHRSASAREMERLAQQMTEQTEVHQEHVKNMTAQLTQMQSLARTNMTTQLEEQAVKYQEELAKQTTENTKRMSEMIEERARTSQQLAGLEQELNEQKSSHQRYVETMTKQFEQLQHVQPTLVTQLEEHATKYEQQLENQMMSLDKNLKMVQEVNPELAMWATEQIVNYKQALEQQQATHDKELASLNSKLKGCRLWQTRCRQAEASLQRLTLTCWRANIHQDENRLSQLGREREQLEQLEELQREQLEYLEMLQTRDTTQAHAQLKELVDITKALEAEAMALRNQLWQCEREKQELQEKLTPKQSPIHVADPQSTDVSSLSNSYGSFPVAALSRWQRYSRETESPPAKTRVSPESAAQIRRREDLKAVKEEMNQLRQLRKKSERRKLG